MIINALTPPMSGIEHIDGGFDLANTESAKKRIRQTEKRTLRNRHIGHQHVLMSKKCAA
jgi:hypothetical protein